MTVYELWSVLPGREDELLETFEFEYQADFVCNELNLASDDVHEMDGSVQPDYRVLAREVA